jgi:GDP-L-fucose synthase
MERNSKIYVAGHPGLVGSAICRRLVSAGYTNIITRTIEELDLTDQSATERFFAQEKPEYVIDAAAKVGGILANDTYRAQFIYENLAIQNNIIHFSWKYGVKKLLFLGSSCIYPKDAPQPLKEEYLLTGPLEYTNEPYAIAKIAGIKMCESYHKQYGCNFISVMPTNLYGPNDNYDLEKSHVLPALLRKMHLGKCLENGDWHAIRRDLAMRPVNGVTGDAAEEVILEVLERFGIHYELRKTKDELNSQISNAEYRMPNTEYRVSVSLWGTGQVYREFLHVDDMADACVFVMEKVEVARGMWHVAGDNLPSAISFLNIGTGRDLTIRELAETVKEIVGFKGQILWDSSKPDGTLKKQLDVSLLNGLGWKERIGIKEGIASVYKSYYAF